MRRVLVVGLAVSLVALLSGCWKGYDFDGDDRADRIVVDQGVWRSLPTGDVLFTGLPTDRWVPADYDGDGRTDVAVVRGDQWITPNSTVTFAPPPAGTTNVFVDPVPADYDGDHRAEPAWYDEHDGTWHVSGWPVVQFGATESAANRHDQDIPVPADYDGDGKADLAVWNPVTTTWKVRSSIDGTATTTVQGSKGDFPVPADYDGDGDAERASSSWFGVWTIEGRAPETFAYDKLPAPADYDGDGRTDLSWFDWDATTTPKSWQVQGSDPALTLPDHSDAATCGPFERCRPFPVEFNVVLAEHATQLTAVMRCGIDPWYC